MKFATYKDGSREGQLLVVSRDLSWAHYATGIASKLQQVLDDWNFMSPQLQDLYEALNSGKARHAFPFEAAQCMAPLPRAYQWANASAFSEPVALAPPAGKAKAADSAATGLLMYQGGGDNFIGPCDDIRALDETWGIDFEAGLAVITGDVALGASPAQALEGVRLVMLANSVTLHSLVSDELSKGYGFLQSKPATAFSPVAVTLDEFGNAWDEGRLHLTLQTTWNTRKVGMCETGPEMTFHFGQLIAHLCKTRPVRAGSVVGSGAVRNQDTSHGYSSIAEKRALEAREDGQPKTDFMKFGDTLRIEAKGKDGQSVFGAIEQTVTALAIA